MNSNIRRIIAVEAHRRRSGRCPVLVHSLGTGEAFEIEPTEFGFLDVASGLHARPGPDGIQIDGRERIDLRLSSDVAFEGYDHGTAEHFSGHAGGGSSVTLYDSRRVDFFQYAVSHRREPPDLLVGA
ncbi:hypothetical protein [Roseomonas chloroacetimidivorans]|uniref:hypothetical protein n=1 Tax=Roseomonas chloroacetimidivorans TaxID=1766656 RepID=UPI003C769DFB